MHNHETKLRGEKRNDSIIIVKDCIWFFIALFLRNKKNHYLQKKRDIGIEIERFLALLLKI